MGYRRVVSRFCNIKRQGEEKAACEAGQEEANECFRSRAEGRLDQVTGSQPSSSAACRRRTFGDTGVKEAWLVGQREATRRCGPGWIRHVGKMSRRGWNGGMISKGREESVEEVLATVGVEAQPVTAADAMIPNTHCELRLVIRTP